MVNDVDEFSPVSRLRNVNQPQEKQNTSFPTREVDSFVLQSVYRATSKNFNINETHWWLISWFNDSSFRIKLVLENICDFFPIYRKFEDIKIRRLKIYRNCDRTIII